MVLVESLPRCWDTDGDDISVYFAWESKEERLLLFISGVCRVEVHDWLFDTRYLVSGENNTGDLKE